MLKKMKTSHQQRQQKTPHKTNKQEQPFFLAHAVKTTKQNTGSPPKSATVKQALSEWTRLSVLLFRQVVPLYSQTHYSHHLKCLNFLSLKKGHLSFFFCSSSHGNQGRDSTDDELAGAIVAKFLPTCETLPSVKTTHERCGPFSLVVLSQRRGRVTTLSGYPAKTLSETLSSKLQLNTFKSPKD